MSTTVLFVNIFASTGRKFTVDTELGKVSKCRQVNIKSTAVVLIPLASVGSSASGMKLSTLGVG